MKKLIDIPEEIVKDLKKMAIDAGYLIGMSVPPVMTAQIAKQVYEQWLSKI